MENIKLIDKLKDKANVSYETARSALENNNWDILDAMLHLEEKGFVNKPPISVFYTNENINREESNDFYEEEKENYSKGRNDFVGIFEAVCKFIDTCNNIFFEIKRDNRILLKIPITVLVVLLFFIFWIIIPLVVVGFFFDFEFSISSKSISKNKLNKINKIFYEITKNVKLIKEKFKKELKND
ncbi:DUF4342 domain-containing protein [Clostridium thermobutyricum]|uniref:UBA/TS-N domain protein n=1 Tax=Clostridium thermobutyricum DSM 4928 TaxID=1121339 RepID=A0A1V4SUN7_9CLOT|nr:DUF4342 domain-containing protein [Clostridium thermobutyricum]OPX47186.1 hypothetical protein CLTHE_21310 [Clostridium thermobutyricum DSM 4928]